MPTPTARSPPPTWRGVWAQLHLASGVQVCKKNTVNSKNKNPETFSLRSQKSKMTGNWADMTHHFEANHQLRRRQPETVKFSLGPLGMSHFEAQTNQIQYKNKRRHPPCDLTYRLRSTYLNYRSDGAIGVLAIKMGFGDVQ